MNESTKKLAATALAMAASAPMVASASPAVTRIKQASNSVEATFANTFGQSVSSDVSLTLTVSNTGQGAAITSAQLNAILGTVSVGGASGVTLGSIPGFSAALSSAATITSLLQITNVQAVGATSVSVTNTVFAVESIKATQSVIDSSSTTLF
jgi:hypothetical protein